MDRTNRNEDKPSRIESQQKPPTRIAAASRGKVAKSISSRRKSKKSADQLRDEMFDAIAAFLRANGWNPLVIGGTRVQQQPFSPSPHHFEFVCNFTGSKTEAKDAA